MLSQMMMAQTNLVPNASFESNSSCPASFTSAFSSVNTWINCGNTPDYFNPCSSTFGVPSNYFGNQYPHSGYGYAGLHRFVAHLNNYREYIECTLSMPLTAGVCYHLEMYINLTNNSMYTAPNISVYFSDTLISGVMGQPLLPFTPQIDNISGNNPDTLSWILVSGNFTAYGGENFLIIGNFNNDASTDTLIYNTQSTNDYSYIYIDDVSLTPCTGLEEQNQIKAIQIYPNPIRNELNISMYNNESLEIILYDVTSRIILQKKFTKLISLDTEQLSSGLYIYELQDKNGLRKKGKIVKE